MSCLDKALSAIAAGYPYTVHHDIRLIFVENPDYRPDDGSGPSLVIEYIPEDS